MNSHLLHRRWITGSLVATITVATLAPAAHAGEGWGHSYKFRRGDRPAYGSHVVYAPRRSFEFRSHSNGGSTLAGFLGGLAVGAILTSAAQSHAAARVETAPPVCDPQPVYAPPQQVYAPPPPACDPQYASSRYSYEDPYCHERFASLDVYMAHVRNHGHHAMRAQVIDNRNDEVVDVIRWDDGRWTSCAQDDRDNGDNGDYGD